MFNLGSGKTIAYLAPLIHRIKQEEDNCGLITRLNRPRACVVVPSRELAHQTMVSFTRDFKLCYINII